uniref:Uncharacterized protein n=1 Tax=Arundo donax TaxID=35708 RepID=A0A0A9ADS3_ARUDO
MLHPVDMTYLNIWAWTHNPSKIPKVMSLIYTHCEHDCLSSSVQVTTSPPEGWHSGTKFQILVHLDLLEDYTANSIFLQGPNGRSLHGLGVADAPVKPTRPPTIHLV